MSKLSADFDLSFLIGKEINQICFGAHQVQLNLNPNISISIECKLDFLYDREGIPDVWSPDSSCLSTRLLQMIGKSFSSYKIQNHSLDLTLSNSDKLVLYFRDDKFESFQITEGKRVVVV